MFFCLCTKFFLGLNVQSLLSFTLSPKFKFLETFILYIVHTHSKRVTSQEATIPSLTSYLFDTVSLQSLETCAEHKLPVVKEEDKVNRVQRAQWLRAAILGANDGLLSTTSLMLGVGAAKEDQWSMILSGLAGALAGACSMAVGEFVSVSTQRDIEHAVLVQYNTSDPNEKVKTNGGDFIVEIISNSDRVFKSNLTMSQASTPSIVIPRREESPSFSGMPVIPSPGRSPVMKVVLTDGRTDATQGAKVDAEKGNEVVPNPYKAAVASASAFLCGSLVPLVPAMFVSENSIRIAVIVVVTSIALVLFGGIGAWLGGSPLRASAARVLVGGWVSMAITYSLLKPLDKVSDQKEHED